MPSNFASRVMCLVAFALAASPAPGQTVQSTKWEIEIHDAQMVPANLTRGTVSVPGPGPSFSTPVGNSRRESSWFFGDGAALFNQVASALGASARISGLDPVLGRPLGERRRGRSIGARVGRVLTSRLSAELTVDYSEAPLQITAPNRDAIEATGASFLSGFNELLRPLGSDPVFGFRDIIVTSMTGFESEDGPQHQVFTSGTLNINLRTAGNLIPYATVGAGLIATTGRTPSATLEGSYRASQPFPGFPAPLRESNNVVVKETREDRMGAAVLGGGLKFHASRRWGVRVDIRAHLTRNTVRTFLDASTDDVKTRAAGVFSLRPPTDPTIVFGGLVSSFGTPIMAYH